MPEPGGISAKNLYSSSSLSCGCLWRDIRKTCANCLSTRWNLGEELVLKQFAQVFRISLQRHPQLSGFHNPGLAPDRFPARFSGVAVKLLSFLPAVVGIEIAG